MTETSSVKPKDDLIPEYYRYDIDRVKTWFKITSFDSVQPEILNEYRVASSQRILMDSLTKGMGSSFIIEEKNE